MKCTCIFKGAMDLFLQISQKHGVKQITGDPSLKASKTLSLSPSTVRRMKAVFLKASSFLTFLNSSKPLTFGIFQSEMIRSTPYSLMLKSAKPPGRENQEENGNVVDRKTLICSKIEALIPLRVL